MSGLIVRLEHVRSVPGFGVRPGLCTGGARAWFARYGLDWNAFRRDGIDAAVLEATGDAFALAVVAYAREVEARGR
ncbi:hypothetical protein [Fulvimonas yonginensis]|uniref:Uncharacterized protein n=1 Tax=Fulvimonas yonginensis TaxID=1495200 RepID=A0ABU8JA44_9GAMM